MTKKYFTELANYNNWSDNIIIEWLKQINEEQWEQSITSSFSSIKQTAIHIVSAKKIWIEFWEKVQAPVYLSTEFNGTKNELIAIWQKASDDLQQFIEKYPEENYHQLINVFISKWKRGENDILAKHFRILLITLLITVDN